MTGHKTALGELFDIGSSKRVLQSQWRTEGVPFYRGREITKLSSNGFVDNELFISEEQYTEYADKYGVPKCDDIMITAIGTIGNSYIVKEGDRFYFKDASVLWLKKVAEVSSDFINFWLKSPRFFVQLDKDNGATVDTLTIQKLKSVMVDLPTLPEQQRIVGILDEADNLRKLRKQADEKMKELVPALFDEMFGDPVQNPKKWKTAKLSEVCRVTGGGTPSKANADYWNGDIPWVSPKDMTSHFIDESQDHITDNAISGSATSLLPVDSILIVTRSGILKHTLPIAINSKPVTINQDIKAFIPSEHVDARFMLYQLHIRSSEILSLVRTGATVQNIETDALKRLTVIVPPIDMQKEFSIRVKDITKIDEYSLFSTQKLDDLFNSLMDKCMSGKIC